MKNVPFAELVISPALTAQKNKKRKVDKNVDKLSDNAILTSKHEVLITLVYHSCSSKYRQIKVIFKIICYSQTNTFKRDQNF